MKPKGVLSDVLPAAGRWLLGGLLLYMGLNKALHPVDFLKILRQYELTDTALILNLIAATLPWFEIFCGLLLVGGVAVRGTAAVSLAMLIPFTVVVFLRAWRVHTAGSIPLCAVRFDCGCGGGEVIVCRKILENSLLILVACALALVPGSRWCLRRDLRPDLGTPGSHRREGSEGGAVTS
jgi:uncharacterized membrane protein YphA (DoxX/SURF4 family)